MDATWHSGPRGRATLTVRGRLRGADLTRGVFIFTIYIIIMMYIGSSDYRKTKY